MKKLFLVLLIAIFAIPTFQSCKKGENDPSISFKSRDARITAEWKLTKIEGTQTTVNSGATTTVTITFDGAIKTTVTTVPGLTPITSTENITFDMTIDKKAKMSWTEVFTILTPASTFTRSGTGTWQWVDSEKEKSFVTVCGPETGGPGDLFTAGTYQIDRLASKELILISESSSNDNGDTKNSTYKFTFTKK
jgi:hypothetical protein